MSFVNEPYQVVQVLGTNGNNVYEMMALRGKRRVKRTESEPESVGGCWRADSSSLWGLSHAHPTPPPPSSCVCVCMCAKLLQSKPPALMKASQRGSNPDRNPAMAYSFNFCCRSRLPHLPRRGRVSCPCARLTLSCGFSLK